jgi:hypothetical protein
MAKNIKGWKRDSADLRKLPEDIVNKMYELADIPEFQHGTGCSCYKFPKTKDLCEPGKPNCYKIARAVKIGDSKTAEMYLDPDYRKQRLEEVKKYSYSNRGKKTRAKYKESESCRSSLSRSTKRRLENKVRRKKHKENQKRFWRSQTGIETMRRWSYIAQEPLLLANIGGERLEDGRKIKNVKLKDRKRVYVRYLSEVLGVEFDEEKDLKPAGLFIDEDGNIQSIKKP